MLSEIISPRFYETDALGHINNTVIPAWFEGARNPLFKIFIPDLNPQTWTLILAKIDVNFHAELFYQHPVELRTYIARLGKSSFDVYQEAWQNDKCCASGTAVMVQFCHEQKKSVPMSEAQHSALSMHLKETV